MTCYPPRSTIVQNFSPIAQMVYEMCVTKFFTLTLGANQWVKVHQKGEDMLPIQVYHPAKFHHPESILAGDIPYKKSCGQTKLRTVNNISLACLLACGLGIIRLPFNQRQKNPKMCVFTYDSMTCSLTLTL